MNRYSLLLAILVSLVHVTASAKAPKQQVNILCEVTVNESVGAETIPLEITVKAEADDEGNFRVSEKKYLEALDACDRRNVFTGRVLPSIVAKVGSTLRPLGSKLRKLVYHEAKNKHQKTDRDPERTMVIFFHGTGSNPIADMQNPSFPSYDEEKGGGELLSSLQTRMREHGAEEGVDFIALHGPGSGNIQIPNLHTKFMVKDAYSHSTGTIAGSGAYENVENAILHLKGITKNPAMEDLMAKQIDRIKRVGKLIVLGWSRGAVTAIQFAHDLHHDPELKNLDVHLFVVDPVPGLGNLTFKAWKNIRYLYPNVKSYFGAYAQDERSTGFTPLVPRVSDHKDLFSKTRKTTVIAEFPGNHATLVGNIWDQKARTELAKTIPSFAALARIVRGLAQAFIISNGGHLSGVEYHLGKPTSTMDELAKMMIQDFSVVLNDMPQFNKLQKESYTGIAQLTASERKYHQDWNVFGNYKWLNETAQTVLPRYTAKDIKGFKIKYNYNDEKSRKEENRDWVNHLHRVMAKSYFAHGNFDVTEFFKPTYYKTYSKLITNKK